MPMYRLACEECGHEEEYYYPLATWNGLKDGETPYPNQCPSCKSKKYLRDGVTNIATNSGAEGLRKHVANQVREDLKKVARGDMDTIQDIAGKGPSGKAPVKYMKDVKKGIKRT